MIRLDDTLRIDDSPVSLGNREVISIPEPEPVREPERTPTGYNPPEDRDDPKEIDPVVTDTGSYQPISTDPISDRVDQIREDVKKEMDNMKAEKDQAQNEATSSIFSNVNPVILPVSILGFIAIIYNYLNK